MKDSAIVVYIPSHGPFLKQFYGLYYSVVYKTDLHTKFDFLIAGPASIKRHLPTKHCIFIEVKEISKEKDFRYVYSDNPYGYTDSFVPFVDARCVEELSKYKYCLRLDVDTFLCPSVRDLAIEENEIHTGEAAYSSETARKKLPQILANLNLPNQDFHNVGSTWFAATETMIEQGARTLDFIKYFLKEEFASGEGSWPQWYAGVILLYAGHMALNSSSLTIKKTNKLDYFSTSPKNISQCYSIHSWHTDQFFSKHWFMSGRYKGREPLPESLQCNEYAFDCTIQGTHLLDDRRRLDKVFALVLGGSRFKASRIKGCTTTWLKNFKNYLISCDGDLGENINHIIATSLKNWHSCPPKLFKGIEAVVKNPHNCDWLLITDDDSFINAFNLSLLVKKLSLSDAKLYGRNMTGNYPFKKRQLKYLSGGAGTLMPMHVAERLLKGIEEHGWMEWLIHPSVWPPRHTTEFPVHGVADGKLGWVAEELGVSQVNLPNLFHSEAPRKYKREQESILERISYHRQDTRGQRQLQKIIDNNIAPLELNCDLLKDGKGKPVPLKDDNCS